jgi:hypothetical protein
LPYLPNPCALHTLTLLSTANESARATKLPSAVQPQPNAAQSNSTAATVRNAPNRQRLITPAGLFFLLVAAVVCLGWWLPTERYITPQRGLGYALGIIGGSTILLLLLYSARKRVRWLVFLGPLARWFQVHMVLGVLGPLCILYHSNFRLGATNSNVALVCMLTVTGSGLVGRYIYSRIHVGLYGSKSSLGELRAGAQQLHALSTTMELLPELVSQLEAYERKVLASGPRLPLLGFTKPIFVAFNSQLARWRLRRYLNRSLRRAERQLPALAADRKRLHRATKSYIDKRLLAARRVAEFEAYERLFSLWHALHLPLSFILLAAGIVHVVAVHVY